MKQKKDLGSIMKREWPLHLMLLPAIVLLLIFAYLPMVGIVIAFQDFVPSGGMLSLIHIYMCIRDSLYGLPLLGTDAVSDGYQAAGPVYLRMQCGYEACQKSASGFS